MMARYEAICKMCKQPIQYNASSFLFGKPKVCPYCRSTEIGSAFEVESDNAVFNEGASNTGNAEAYYQNVAGSGGGSSGSSTLIGGLITLGLLGLAGWLIYSFMIWLWGIVVAICTFIWNVVTWPFRFTWHSFENVISGSTSLVGINHNPAWWETTILLSIIIGVGLFLMGWAYENKNKEQTTEKVNQQRGAITIFLFALAGIYACGIWVTPASKPEAPVLATKVEEPAQEQKVETAPQEQAQSAPVTAAPITQAVDNTPFAPSFDCAKASNNAEKMICGDRNLSSLDVQLHELYIASRDKVADKDKLKSEQVAWIKQARLCPDTVCLTKAFQDRIKQLSN
jgi:uncharacterized protein YecT (DUF1311 family)